MLVKNLKDLVGLQRYLQKPASILRHMYGYSPFPMMIMLYVTFRCNLKCQMCTQKEAYVGGAAGEKDPMRIEEWEGVLDNIQASFPFKPFIHVMGGEPLLFPHISPLLHSLRERGFRVSMTSNGLILKNNIQLILDAGIWHLNVSVDGPADVHDRIRGVPNGFKRTTEAISLLQRRKSELGLETPRICVNCVISPNNVDLLADMVSIVREVGADSLTFQHLMFTAEEYEKNERIDVERLLDAIDKVEVAKNGMPASFFPRVGEDNISPYYADLSHDFGDFCITPWYRFDIFPNGDVGVCRKVFSNIRQGQTLRTIWNGKPFRGFRKSLVKRGLYLPHCLRCCHRQYG